jgi:hypothetical protein
MALSLDAKSVVGQHGAYHGNVPKCYVIGHYDVRLIEVEILWVLHFHLHKHYLEHKLEHRPHRLEHHTRIANKQQHKSCHQYDKRHIEQHRPKVERHEKLTYLFEKI